MTGDRENDRDNRKIVGWGGSERTLLSLLSSHSVV